MSISFMVGPHRVRFAGKTDIGRVRAQNEDNVLVPKEMALAVVSDGMGGHASGEVASRITVETIDQYYRETARTGQTTWPIKLPNLEVERQRMAVATHVGGDARGVALASAMERAIEGAEQPAEPAIDQPRERIGRRVARPQQHGGQRRRQRQRVDHRDQRGNRDRDRELAVELPADAIEERQRHEHRREHQADGDDRAGHFAHGLVRSRARREPGLDVALDVLDHDDRVVDHDADREHQAEQRQRVDGEAEQQQHGESADDRDGHGEQRDHRGAPGLQEQHHDHDHEQHGLEKRRHHGADLVC